MVMFLILLIVILVMAVMYFSIKARNDALKSTASLNDLNKVANEKTYSGIAEKMPKNPTMEDMRNLVNRLQERLYQSELRNKPSGLNPILKPDANMVGKSEKVEDATSTIGALSSGVQDFALRPTTLIIRFRPGALDMTEVEATRMKSIFTKHFDYSVGDGQNFVITVDAVEGLSESNRMAYYRVAAVRNSLMAVVGVPAARISQKILAVPANSISGTEALEVRITKVN